MFERNERRQRLASQIVAWMSSLRDRLVRYESITERFDVEYKSNDWKSLFGPNGLVRRKLQNEHSMVYRCEAGVAFRLVRPEDAVKDIVVHRHKRADGQIKRGVKEIQTVDIASVPENERSIVLQSQELWERDRKTARAQLAVIRANQK